MGVLSDGCHFWRATKYLAASPIREAVILFSLARYAAVVASCHQKAQFQSGPARAGQGNSCSRIQMLQTTG